MRPPITIQPGAATRAGVPGGDPDAHLASIPACGALGMCVVADGDHALALALDPRLPATRTAGGGIDPGAALLLADQATANGIFATMPAPSPMMTLQLRVDWIAAPRTGTLVCAVADVVRDGDLALVRGILRDDDGLSATVTARYLVGAMPGGFRDVPFGDGTTPPSDAASFDAWLDIQDGGEALTIVPRPDHVGARLLPAFHGGVVSALIERAGRRHLAPGFRALDTDVRFLAPARADLPLHASVQPRRSGRRAATIDITAYQDDPARPVAVGRLTAISDAPATVTAYRLAQA